MAEDGEDWNGLEMTILKSLVNFFKLHKRWRSAFNVKPIGLVQCNAFFVFNPSKLKLNSIFEVFFKKNIPGV